MLVQSIALSGASSAFTVTAHALGFELDSFSPTTINNAGAVTLQLKGGQLSAGMTYQITDSAGNVYTATSVNVVNSSLVDATFDLGGIPTGGFSVSVSDPQQDPTLSGGNVVAGDPGKPNATVTTSPAVVKCGQSYMVNVSIANTGGSDVTLYNLKLNGTLFAAGPITIAAGSTWPQSGPKSFPETAGTYDPGSTNYENWNLTADYAPQNQPAAGNVATVSTSPNVELANGNFAVSDTVQLQSVNASIVQQVLNAQGFTATNNWTLNSNTVVLNSATIFNVSTYSLFPNGDNSQVGETMDFNIGSNANVPMPNVPKGSTATLHWLQYVNSNAKVNGYGFQIVPLNRFWQMDNGQANGGAASGPATGPYLDSNGDSLYAVGNAFGPPNFGDSPMYYSDADTTYLHFVTIPTWDVFTPASGMTPASETIYVANEGLAWGFSVQAPLKLTASAKEKVVQSGDPNDMQAGGFGPQGWIAGNQTIPYTIDFENMPKAAAPAAQVVITTQLSANLDWSTFQLQQIYFNNVEIQVPPGLQNYTTQVHVATDPNPVDVTAAFNPNTGVVTWTMTSIDPVTGQEVTDPLAGFLPPDNADFDGSGLVSYSIDPEPGLPSGTQITGQASIVFDVNAAMETPQTLNTVDVTPPTSSVSPLPATESQTNFNVSWSGQDLNPDSSAGSGIASYNVYVSDDGGPFTLWQSDTTQTSATYTGVNGQTYGFYTVATDNVGNVQPTPTAAQESTTVLLSQTIDFGPLSNQTFGNAPFSVSANASSGLPVSFSIIAGGQYASISGDTITLLGATPMGTVVTVEADQAGNGNYSAAPAVDQSFTIAQANTSTQVASSANPSVYGQAVTFTATVSNTSEGSTPVPTGTVQFVVDGITFGAPVPVGPTGQAVSLPDIFLSGASHIVQAVYTNSDGNFIGSQSTNLTQTVQQIAVEPDPSNPALTDLFFGSNGANSSDTILVNPVGSGNTGSTGVKIQTALNGVKTQVTYNQSFWDIYIFLQGGNDTIQFADSLTISSMIAAGNGNDNVTLGNGNNTVTLGNGNDNVQVGNEDLNWFSNWRNQWCGDIPTGSGNNSVTLGNGNDNVRLSNGSNTVTLGNGWGNVQAGDGSNTVKVGNGNDYIQLGNGNNMVAGTGNDWVQLGNGNNTVTLGDGCDIIQVGNGSNTVTAGNGKDFVQLGNQCQGWCENWGGNIQTGSNIVTLGNGKDYVQAGNGHNNVTVGNGDDTVQLGNGNNTVIAGSGNDNISAGDGTNKVTAGTIGSTGTIQVQLGNGAGNLVTLYGNGNDQVQGGNGANNTVIIAGNGNDQVNLGDGASDMVTITDTGKGNDQVQVGNGNGDSVSILGNGTGNDQVQVGNGNGDSVSITGNGNETVKVGNGTGDSVTITGNGNETVQTGKGTGQVTITGTGKRTLNLGKGWTHN